VNLLAMSSVVKGQVLLMTLVLKQASMVPSMLDLIFSSGLLWVVIELDFRLEIDLQYSTSIYYCFLWANYCLDLTSTYKYHLSFLKYLYPLAFSTLHAVL
jgi:hypothetical protein